MPRYGPASKLRFDNVRCESRGESMRIYPSDAYSGIAYINPIRMIFREAFDVAGLPYFPPHTFQHALGHLIEDVCATAAQIKAWTQNLGHENATTTLTSYEKIDAHRQGEVIGAISIGETTGEGDILASIRELIARKARK